MNGDKKILSYIGLARRGGMVAIGSESVMSEIRRPGASGRCAVVLSLDASERTKKQITDKCAYYNVPLIASKVTGDELSRAVGKSMTVSAVALTDKGLASAVIKASHGECGRDLPEGENKQFNERTFPRDGGNR
ncbi:MAG: ribosomal L7Ae/L30e/S12e/Gadd45 family protein [Clostridia bacterium]|nr:ribosomal L7Ae/L30e/S12e/Gadd45 family protein [Clostridia bacterium]